MKSLILAFLVCTTAVTFAIAVNLHPSSISADDGWIPLLNGKNFDGWYSYTETGGKNNDPTHVFKLEDGAVHILDVAPGAKFEKGDVRSNHKPEDVDRKLAEVQKIQKEEVPPGTPMAQWALAWCLQHPAVTTVIPGCKDVQQVADNAAAAGLAIVKDDHPQAVK